MAKDICISNIDTALRIYYEKPEIGCREIRELFNITSSATVSKLKDMARDEMLESNIKTFGRHSVNTEAAYRAWHIDIEALEKRRAKLKKLGLNA